jgi:hypothetical protein
MTRTHPITMLLAAIALLLTGCTTPEDATLNTAATASAETASWNLTGEVTLGYVAAVGAQDPKGDLVVGLTTPEQCPQAYFLVPQGTKTVSVVLTAVGPSNPHTVALSSPNWTAYQDVVPPGEFSQTESNPEPGLWGLRVYPVGASVNTRWPATVNLGGIGEGPTALDLKTEISCRA